MARWELVLPFGQATPRLELIKQRFDVASQLQRETPLTASRLDGCCWSNRGDIPQSHDALVEDEPASLCVSPSKSVEAMRELTALAGLALAELGHLGVRVITPVGTDLMEKWVYFVTEVLSCDRAIREQLGECGVVCMNRQRAVQIRDFLRASRIALEHAYPSPPKARRPRAIHSEDFTSVDWFGPLHRFAKGRQAETVRALWSEYEKRPGFGLSEKTIGARVDSEADNFRLEHVFRNHPTWTSIIKPVGKGVYALCEPEILERTEEAHSAHHLAHGSDARLMA